MKNVEGIKKDHPLFKYIEIIKDYMSIEYVDYALMLDGKWGSGKTFFVNNDLKIALKKDKKYLVHVSLYGKTSIEQVNNDVINRVVFHYESSKKAFKVRDFSSELFSSGGMKTKFIFGSVSELVRFGFLNKLEKNGLGTNTLFVFDDVERCNPDAVEDLLGSIHSQYSELGYHVLFIADESKLLENKNYWTRKEKMIRTTVHFSYSNLEELIKSVVQNKTGTPILSLMRKDPEAFIGFVRQVKSVENLRTWQASIDYFNLIAKKCNYSDDYQFLLNLFCIVFLTVYYTRENEKLFESPLISIDENEETLERRIRKDFGIENVSGFGFGRVFQLRYQSSQVKFGRMNSVYNAVKTGFVDPEAITEEMESYFPQGTLAEHALVGLYDYHSLTQEKLGECLRVIISSVSNNEFNLVKLISLSNFFCAFEEIGYLSLYNHEFDNYQSIFESTVNRLDKNMVGDFFVGSKLERSGYKEYKEHPNFLEPFIDSLAKEYIDPDEESKRFNEIITNLTPKNVLNIEYDYRKNLIGKMKEYGLFPLLLSFSCESIAALEMHLYDISRFDNSNQLYSSEVEPLKELKLFLGQSIKSLSLSKQRIELQQLINSIENCIKKLEA